ncbi:FGGY-family carbohydrate kinase [Shimia biformata]|uniref:FGGY-family carbohydrate kinase n=1 Tax=Shimia biformata TaxID=1294299 RepID=UPI00194ED1A3|nr:FGGY-family carbohydrate kinase [Shimia biformata]
MTNRHIAVIDIGKTNAKLALVDLSDLSEIAVVTRPNKVLPGPPWPHFDVDGHWDFLLDALRQFHRDHSIDAITITTHGACAALLDENGSLAAPILDYEFDGPDAAAEDYCRVRPDFSETGSPGLPMGLNLGAQLHWQFVTDPLLLGRTQTIVTYPGYWGFRLTGVAASEPTSLGCHTDVWAPYEGNYSSLAARLNIREKLAPVKQPGEMLGPILPIVAKKTGLPADTLVYCGIHDSNASLLRYLLNDTGPKSIVSTGTWVIAMSLGGREIPLDATKDVLVNVNALGQPVPSARFMGGREYDLAIGKNPPPPTTEDVEAVLRERVMLMPSLEPDSGPFQGHLARWIGSEPPIGSAGRGAAVALYLALMTSECLSNIGHSGEIVVEGPFNRNEMFLHALAAVTGSKVLAADGATGTSQGAALLAGRSSPHNMDNLRPFSGSIFDRDAVQAYAMAWRDLAQG